MGGTKGSGPRDSEVQLGKHEVLSDQVLRPEKISRLLALLSRLLPSGSSFLVRKSSICLPLSYQLSSYQ